MEPLSAAQWRAVQPSVSLWLMSAPFSRRNVSAGTSFSLASKCRLPRGCGRKDRLKRPMLKAEGRLCHKTISIWCCLSFRPHTERLHLAHHVYCMTMTIQAIIGSILEKKVILAEKSAVW